MQIGSQIFRVNSGPETPPIGRPTLQDVTYKGKTIKKGVQLWPVGTEIIKSSIMARLNNKKR